MFSVSYVVGTSRQYTECVNQCIRILVQSKICKMWYVCRKIALLGYTFVIPYSGVEGCTSICTVLTVHVLSNECRLVQYQLMIDWILKKTHIKTGTCVYPCSEWYDFNICCHCSSLILTANVAVKWCIPTKWHWEIFAFLNVEEGVFLAQIYIPLYFEYRVVLFWI